MKPSIIAIGVLCVIIALGTYVSVFGTVVEYHYPDPLAHIEGATPSHTERWEMY